MKDLWTNYRKTSLWKLHVAFIEALRLLLNTLRWLSASEMFVTAGATTFKVLLTHLIHKYICMHMKQIQGFAPHVITLHCGDTGIGAERCIFISFSLVFVLLYVICFVSMDIKID